MKAQNRPQSIIGEQSDPLYDNAQAAAYLGLAENTLSVWRCVGRYDIPFIKVGRLVRYRKSALDAFLERRTHSRVEGI
jgi:excisionase family DNA binding protein